MGKCGSSCLPVAIVVGPRWYNESGDLRPREVSVSAEREVRYRKGIKTFFHLIVGKGVGASSLWRMEITEFRAESKLYLRWPGLISGKAS